MPADQLPANQCGLPQLHTEGLAHTLHPAAAARGVPCCRRCHGRPAWFVWAQQHWAPWAPPRSGTEASMHHLPTMQPATSVPPHGTFPPSLHLNCPSGMTSASVLKGCCGGGHVERERISVAGAIMIWLALSVPILFYSYWSHSTYTKGGLKHWHSSSGGPQVGGLQRQWVTHVSGSACGGETWTAVLAMTLCFLRDSCLFNIHLIFSSCWSPLVTSALGCRRSLP